MSPLHPLPDGWAIKPLGDPGLARINPAYSLTGGPYPFVPMDAVENNFGGIAYFDTVNEASGGYSRFKEGDILFAKITPCSENGKIALIECIGEKLCLGSTEFHVISPAKGVDGRFLYYLFSSGYVHRLTVSLMEGTTGRQRIPASIFKKRLAVPVPLDESEQQRIASIIGAVDSAIAATKASIEAAQKLKKGLMQNLLTGRLKPDGTWRREDEFYTDQKFGRIPKRWTARPLKTFGEIITGRTPPPADEGNYTTKGYCFITPGDLGNDKFVTYSERYISSKGLRLSPTIASGALCVVCIGSTIGKIGITTSECCTNQQINSLVPNSKTAVEFLFYKLFLECERLKQYAGINATPQINKGQFAKYKIVAPEDKSEQIAIASKLGQLSTLEESKQVKIVTLQKLKKSLMQNLLTGKVRVLMKED